mmetsp:Transcript_33399/g.48343  ORF Transcript_33399/g.48343 Transcript_33399/m.48343 type:complete len:270 (-) Transcript_33399:222-1031(-)
MIIKKLSRFDIHRYKVVLFFVVLIFIVSFLYLSLFLVICIIQLFLLLFLLLCLFFHPLFIWNPTVRYSILFVANIFKYLLNTLVFPNKLERRLRPNSTNAIAIITPQQNAQVYKLIMRQTQPLHSLFVIHNLNITLGSIRKRHLPQQYRSSKGQRVHIFCSDSVYFPSFAHARSLSFCFTRRHDNWNAHELEQFLAVLVLLFTSNDEAFLLFLLRFGVIFFNGNFELRFRFLTFLATFFQFARFKLWRFTIEYKRRTNALRHEADGTVE